MPSSLMGSNAFTIGPPYSDTMLFTSEVEASGLDYEIILQPPVLFWKLSSNRDSAPNTSNESRYSGKTITSSTLMVRYSYLTAFSYSQSITTTLS